MSAAAAFASLVAAFVHTPDVRFTQSPCATVGGRRPNAQCLINDDGINFSALRAELAKRSNEDGAAKLEFAPGLGRFEAMQEIGPHHTTTPREVVEYVVTKLREGDMDEAFTFTCIPNAKRGCHKSSTDWRRRMAWDRARVIGDAPSGTAHEHDAFAEMVRTTYAPLLKTEGYRFIGDDSAWQQKGGLESATAVKEYVVELKTIGGDHMLIKFELVYDWLLHCHLIATVGILSAMSTKSFPGSEDINLDI